MYSPVVSMQNAPAEKQCGGEWVVITMIRAVRNLDKQMT